MPAFRVTTVPKRELDAPGRRASPTLATEDGQEVELSVGADVLPQIAAEVELLADSAAQQIRGKPTASEDCPRYVQKWLVEDVSVFPDLKLEQITVLLHKPAPFRVAWQLQSLDLVEHLARMLDDAAATARE